MAQTARERQRRHRERRRAQLQAPSLVRKAADPSIPSEALEPYEQAVREVRSAIIADLGGLPALSTTKALQVDSLVARWIVVQMLELDIVRLARAGHLVDLRSRRATPLLLDWDRLAGSYERALAAVGLDRVAGASEQERLLADLDRRLARSPQVEREAETGGHAAAGDVESAPGTSGPGQAVQDPEAEAGPVTDDVAEAAGRAAARILGTWVTVPEPEPVTVEVPEF